MALRTLWRRNGALLNNSHPTSEEVEYKLARDFGKTYQIAIIIQRSLVQYIVLCMYTPVKNDPKNDRGRHSLRSAG